MNIKIFCRCSLFPSWSGEGLISTPVLQLVKKFPAFYGTRRFITELIRAHDPFLSSGSSIQSMLPPHHHAF